MTTTGTANPNPPASLHADCGTDSLLIDTSVFLADSDSSLIIERTASDVPAQLTWDNAIVSSSNRLLPDQCGGLLWKVTARSTTTEDHFLDIKGERCEADPESICSTGDSHSVSVNLTDPSILQV